MSEPRSLLTFRRGSSAYAVDVDHVRRVVAGVKLRSLPATPAFVAGGARVDDRLEVMVDPESLFSGGEPAPEAARIVLVTATGQPLGLLADAVEAVAQVDPEDIAPPLPFLGGHRRAAVTGVLSRGPEEVLVLDLARLLTGEEASGLARQTAPPRP